MFIKKKLKSLNWLNWVNNDSSHGKDENRIFDCSKSDFVGIQNKIGDSIKYSDFQTIGSPVEKTI